MVHMFTNRRVAAVAVVVAVALPLSACGGDDDEPTNGADAPATEQTDGIDDDANTATITIAGFAFDGVTEVAVGTTVIVTNTDGAQHTWTALDGTFDSGALGEGESFEFTFTEPGSFDYQCNFHPSMTGTIVVTG